MVTHLCPKGQITIKHCTEFQESFFKQVEKEQPEHVVLDLSDIAFIDSTGISLIVKLSKKCKKEKVGFSIMGCKKRTMELLKLLKLDLIFPIN
jgi:anti-anti-sigma factor